MYRLILFSLVLLATNGLALDSRHVFRSPQEIVGFGDFDGDGTGDTVVLDRDSGQLRIGLGQNGGALAWQPPRPTGVSPSSDLATGPFLASSTDQIAVTGPDANRVVFIAPQEDITRPTTVTTFGIGSGALAAIEFPRLAGNSAAHLDLYTLTDRNDPPNTHKQHLLQAGPSSVRDVFSGFVTAGRHSPRRAPLLNNAPARLVVIDPGANTETMRAFDAATQPGGAALTSASLPGLDYAYVSASFISNFANRNQFICWQQGADSVQIIRTTAAGALQAPLARALGAGAIESVSVVEASGETGFLVIADAGARATLFTIAFGTVINEELTVEAPAGQRFTSASAYRANEFALLSSPASGGPSDRSDRFTHDGSIWVPNGIDTLPTPLPDASMANLFLFEGEPLVDEQPRLDEVVHVPDWTTSFSLASGGSVTVGREFFVGSTTGLSNTTTLNTSVSSSVTHALTNQPRDDFSVASSRAPLGPLPPDVRIDPPGGVYSRYVAPVVSSSLASAFYRTSPSETWTLSTGAPIVLPGSTLSDVTVEYYAQDTSTGLRSPIFSATYRFDGFIDSDGDGVPDFVELARGIADPTAGADTDADGFSDLVEILEETDPGNPASQPAANARLRSPAAFDLTVSPLSHNTAQPGVSDRPSAGDTNVRAYTTRGSLLAHELTNIASATLKNLPASPRDGFVVLGTDTNFNALRGGIVSFPEGRELVGLVPVPDLSFGPFEFTPSGGGADQQAAAWIAQAGTHFQQAPQQLLTEDLTLEDTLHLLLFERLLALRISNRFPGFDPDTATLTPHRDPGLTPIPPELALAVQEYRGSTDQGVLLHALYQHVTGSTDPRVARLRQLASELYRLKTGGGSPGLYPNPIDTLRDLIRAAPQATGSPAAPDLPGSGTSYDADVALDTAGRIQANNALAHLLETVPERSTITFNARVISSTFDQPVPIIGREAGGLVLQEALYDSRGEPFRFPVDYRLPVGTRLAITAHDDRNGVLPAVNFARGLEVVSAEVTSYPLPPAEDTNRNLLDDAFESFFFIGGNASPFSDTDGDGFTTFQEGLEGTDPTDSNSFPSTAPLPPAPPEVTAEWGDTDLTFTIHFPTSYSNQVKFALARSTTLDLFTPSPTNEEALPDAAGAYTLTIPATSAPRLFFRFDMSLR